MKESPIISNLHRRFCEGRACRCQLWVGICIIASSLRSGTAIWSNFTPKCSSKYHWGHVLTAVNVKGIFSLLAARIRKEIPCDKAHNDIVMELWSAIGTYDRDWFRKERQAALRGNALFLMLSWLNCYCCARIDEVLQPAGTWRCMDSLVTEVCARYIKRTMFCTCVRCIKYCTWDRSCM